MRVESRGVGPGVVTAALVFLGCISQPRAEGGPFGAGIIVGEPTGLSLKYFLDRRHAFDVAIDYSLYDSALYVHADYLLHFSGWLVRGYAARVSPTSSFGPGRGIAGGRDLR